MTQPVTKLILISIDCYKQDSDMKKPLEECATRIYENHIVGLIRYTKILGQFAVAPEVTFVNRTQYNKLKLNVPLYESLSLGRVPTNGGKNSGRRLHKSVPVFRQPDWERS